MPSPLASPPDQHTGITGSAAQRLALTKSGDPAHPLAELAGEPVTIGAGPRCAIRLTDAGLRPLHCVVTPTEEGPRVRRWAPGSQLNGADFEEAPLACGDRLMLGEVELLVVNLADEADEPVGVDGEERLPNEATTASLVTHSDFFIEPVDSEAGTVPDPIDLAALAGNEWAIPSDYESVPVRLEEGIAESVRAWSEALPALQEGEAFAPLPETPDYEAEIDSLREQLAVAVSAAEESASVAERLDRRQRSNRRRAQRLVEELRRRHGDADLMRRASEERDQTLIELQTRLDSALALGDAVRVEFAQMQAAHALELESQAERLEAEHAAELANTQSFGVAEPPANEIEETSVEPAQALASTETAEASPAPVEAELIRPEGPAWGDASGVDNAEPPASDPSDEETAPELDAEANWGAEARLQLDPSEGIELAADPSLAEDESPWGIERLATAEEAALPDEPAEVLDQGEEAAPLRDTQAAERSAEPMVDWFAGEATPDQGEGAADTPVQAESPEQAEAQAEPQSFIEKYGHLLPDEDEEVEPPAPVEAAPESVAGEEESGESIDDYMSRLMQRVRGEAPAPHERIEATEGAASPSSQPPAQPAEPAAASVASPSREPIQSLSELTRSEAPEASADMEALRELANQSARSAIRVASKKQSQEHAVVHLAGSVIGILAGAVASMTATSPGSLQFLVGLVAVLGGGWYGVKTLGFFQSVATEQELAKTTEQELTETSEQA